MNRSWPLLTTKENDKETCSLLLFCPKYDVDNPYYSPNRRLHALTDMVGTLIKDFSAELIRISGGHRSPLTNNCEAVVKLPFPVQTTINEIEQMMKNLMDDSLVDFRIPDNERCTSATADVE